MEIVETPKMYDTPASRGSNSDTPVLLVWILSISDANLRLLPSEGPDTEEQTV